MVVILLSRKTDYALRALIFLAGQEDEALLSSSDISRRLRIPRDFLAKILQVLSRAKVIQSIRGRYGGIRIKDRKVSLLRIIEIFERGITLNKCLAGGYYCFLKKACPLHDLLKELESGFRKKLSRITLNDLVNGRR